MNRRKLLQYGALGSASLLANMGLLNQKKTNAFSSESMNKKKFMTGYFYTGCLMTITSHTLVNPSFR